MAMPIPNLSFTGGAAESGVEGDVSTGGYWTSTGGRTKTLVFAPDSGLVATGATAGGGSTMPWWVWLVLAGAALLGIFLLKR